MLATMTLSGIYGIPTFRSASGGRHQQVRLSDCRSLTSGMVTRSPHTGSGIPLSGFSGERDVIYQGRPAEHGRRHPDHHEVV